MNEETRPTPQAELNALHREVVTARVERDKANALLTEKAEEYKRANLRFERARLWAKATQLRKELADVERSASLIQMDGRD
jgi:hypothetical protein